ncbi:MAG: tetratricopeptide repeat protein [Chloroflexota bacterium]
MLFDGEHHAHIATHAALALQQALDGYIWNIPTIGAIPVHLHIGIDSGSMAFTSAGTHHTFYYGMLGTTVNRVAQAEHHAGPGEVVVGPGTWAALHNQVNGEMVIDQFFRIQSIHPPIQSHQVLPDEFSISELPEQAIPLIVADLEQLSPFLPPVLLNRILIEPQQPRLEAELRPVTVLFAQVIELEQIIEALPASFAAQVIQIYVGTMQRVIEQCGGVIDKLDIASEGFKLFAVFGAPAAYEDHAERAARAALEMQRQLPDIRRQIARLLETVQRNNDYTDVIQGIEHLEDRAIAICTLPPVSAPTATQTPPSHHLNQRIGLNIGTAFAGNVGSAARKEYTVMGDAINVAARVMSKAQWGDIWCSADTMQAIVKRMDGEARGTVTVKGKSKTITLFRLIGERDPQATIILRDDSEIFGRNTEIQWLQEHLQAAIRGDGRVVRIVGEAGVGKTRLTTELLELATEHNVRIIPAVCLSYNASIPYAAWREFLKALCGFEPKDDSTIRARKMSERLTDLGPNMEEWLPLFNDLAYLNIPENWMVRSLDPYARQTRRFELLEQLLLHAAASGPILVLFEDLHWADPISLSLWQQVAHTIQNASILLLGIHRPTTIMTNDDNAHMLELRELSTQEGRQMVENLLDGMPITETLLQKIVDRAGGNPLFLVELLRAVLDQHQDLENLPDSLSGLLLARIDELDEMSRSVLRVASVIGQRIPFGVLQSIQNHDQETLLRQLTHLDEQKLTLLERLKPERIHTFRHALFQEVAYQSMLYARRRKLHGRIGAYLERRYHDQLEEYYGLLAHHYRLSDKQDKAIEYLLKAGHRARDLFANDEALQHYEWALEALNNDIFDARLLQVYDAYADVLATIGRYDEALVQHNHILATPDIGPETACQAHCKRGSILEKQGHYDAALEALNQAMIIAHSGAPGVSSLTIPSISADMALVYRRHGKHDLAITACENGLQSLNSHTDVQNTELIEARLHLELGSVYGLRGDYPTARYHFKRSLNIREALDDVHGIIVSRNNIGYLWQLQSEYEKALEHYHVAKELAQKINLRYMLIYIATNEAYALISLGLYSEAQSRCEHALNWSRELKAQHNIAQIQNTLGIIFYRTGEYEQALSAHYQALHLNQLLESSYQEANTLVHIALTRSLIEDFDQAAAVAQQTLESAQKLESHVLQVEALNALTEATIGKGDIASARTYADQSVTMASLLESKEELGIALRLRGTIASLHHEPFHNDFELSIAIFKETKDTFELGRTYVAFGQVLIENSHDIDGYRHLKMAEASFIQVGAMGELRRLTPLLERSP